MKKIASLFAASICLLSLCCQPLPAPSPKSGWGWHAPKASEASRRVSVVTDAPRSGRDEGTRRLRRCMAKYEEAIAAVRSAIVEDSHLKAALDAKGRGAR